MYWRLFRSAIQGKMDYRGNFLVFVVALLFYYTAQFGVVFAIMEKFKDIGGWNKGEVAFLYGLLIFAQGINAFFFSGLLEVSEMIRLGEMDRILVRPVSVLPYILSSKFDPAGVSHLVMGVVVMAMCFGLLDIEWSWIKVLFFLPIVLAGAMIFGAIRILIASVAFWAVDNRALIHLFVFSSKEFLLYPIHIYDKLVQILLTFILPLAFINYYPAYLFLEKDRSFILHPYLPVMSIPVAIGLFSFSVWVFNRSIGFYRSVGH